MNFELGMKANFWHVVKEGDLATAWKNDFPVLATPILLWLMEVCSMKVLHKKLHVEEMTLGTAHYGQHLAATGLGHRILISAELTKIRKNKLTFEVRAQEGSILLYRGVHQRFLVQKEKFLSKLNREKSHA